MSGADCKATLPQLIENVEKKTLDLEQAKGSGNDEAIIEACNTVRIACQRVGVRFADRAGTESLNQLRANALDTLRGALDSIPEQADVRYNLTISDSMRIVELSDDLNRLMEFLNDQLETLFEHA